MSKFNFPNFCRSVDQSLFSNRSHFQQVLSLQHFSNVATINVWWIKLQESLTRSGLFKYARNLKMNIPVVFLFKQSGKSLIKKSVSVFLSTNILINGAGRFIIDKVCPVLMTGCYSIQTRHCCVFAAVCMIAVIETNDVRDYTVDFFFFFTAHWVKNVVIVILLYQNKTYIWSSGEFWSFTSRFPLEEQKKNHSYQIHYISI